MGGCTAVLWRAVSGPIDAANVFLGYVQDENYGGAATLLAPECFDDGGSADALERIFSDGVEDYRLSGTSANSSNGTTTGGASGRITFTGGDERSIDFNLVKQSNWYICGFNIGAPGS